MSKWSDGRCDDSDDDDNDDDGNGGDDIDILEDRASQRIITVSGSSNTDTSFSFNITLDPQSVDPAGRVHLSNVPLYRVAYNPSNKFLLS